MGLKKSGRSEAVSIFSARIMGECPISGLFDESCAVSSGLGWVWVYFGVFTSVQSGIHFCACISVTMYCATLSCVSFAPIGLARAVDYVGPGGLGSDLSSAPTGLDRVPP